MTNQPTAESISPTETRQYFTVAQANQSLPYVNRVVKDIVDCYAEAVEIRRQIEAGENDADGLKTKYEAEMDRLSSFIEELHAVGAELKDFERGLVDFPARHDERDIYLCWHLDEASVSHWHELDSGFTGRQNIASLDAATLGVDQPEQSTK